MRTLVKVVLVHPNALQRLAISNAIRGIDAIELVGAYGSVEDLDRAVSKSGVPEVVLLFAELASSWSTLGVAQSQPRWDNTLCTVMSLPQEEDSESLASWLRRILTPTLVAARFGPLVARRATTNPKSPAFAPPSSACTTPRLAAKPIPNDAKPQRASTPRSDIHQAVNIAVQRVAAVAQRQNTHRERCIANALEPTRHMERVEHANPSGRSAAPAALATVSLTALRQRPRWQGASIIVIASSTGGPDALALVLAQLPPTLDAPVMVVQHMSEHFTPQFAQRLNRLCPLEVELAIDGGSPVAGQVWLAPGGQHVEFERVRGRLVVSLSGAPPVHGCRPAADVTLLSLTHAAPGEVLVVVLTGMGEDGGAGAAALHDTGCAVIAQDEASSVVWGMPGAVVKRDAADEVVPLGLIAERIAALAQRDIYADATDAPLKAKHSRAARTA